MNPSINKSSIVNFFLFFSIFHLITAEISMIPFLLKDIFGVYQYNYVSIFLFFMTILLYVSSQDKFYTPLVWYFNTYLTIGLVVLFLNILVDNLNSVYTIDGFSLKDSLMYTLKYFMIFILMLILLTRTPTTIKSFFKLYVFTATFYSILSFLSFLIFVYDTSIFDNHTIVTSEENHKIFSWFFYLSIINITPTDQRFIFDLQLPMLYSWFLEPQFVSFYIMPSLFIIKYIDLGYKKLILFINILALILTSSFTTYFVLSVVLFWMLYNRSHFILKSLYFAIFLVVFFSFYSGIEIDDKSLLNKFNSYSAEHSSLVLETSLTGDSLIGKPLQMLRREVAETFQVCKGGSFVNLALIFIFIVFMFFILLKNIQKKDSFHFIILMMLVFLLKDVVMYIYMPIFLFFYLVYIYFIQNQKNKFSIEKL